VVLADVDEDVRADLRGVPDARDAVDESNPGDGHPQVDAGFRIVAMSLR